MSETEQLLSRIAAALEALVPGRGAASDWLSSPAYV